MSALSVQQELLKSTLAAKFPARVVTRDFQDFAQHSDADLAAGVYTLIALGERGFANFVGREAQLGTRNVMILAQIKLAESTTPSAAEDAEGVLIDEIKDFCNDVLPAGIDGLLLTSYKQSGQMEHPNAWVAFEMEIAQ